MFAVIATADLKGLRNRVGTICLAGRDAVFFTRKWRRLVAWQIGPLTAIEIEDGLVVDEFALVLADGFRKRFTLLAGQSQSTRAEVKRLSPPASAL